MGRAAERRLKEGWPEQFRVPGYAPVEFIGLAEAERSPKVRPGGKEEVQDAVAVAAGEPASENFEVQGAPLFGDRIFERVIERAYPNLVDCPERMIRLGKRRDRWHIWINRWRVWGSHWRIEVGRSSRHDAKAHLQRNR